MAELQVTFTADERMYLVQLLEQLLKEKRVEEHRTRVLSYRDGVLKEEDLLNKLLDKLRE